MSGAGIPSAVLRRERAQRAVDRLAAEIERWLAGWSERPEQTSQLQRLGKTLRALLVLLKQRADAIAPATGFAEARAVDADLAVVERVWRHYADRLDQRRDPRLAPTLRAADDVIWACTTAARDLVGAATPSVMPLPLAYVEPAYSPTAIPRSKPPADLQSSDLAFARILAFLPVPLIGLPTSVVDEPWWLVLIAHEVGHHVQYDLEPAAALLDRTADLLAAAGGPDAAIWRRWREEVFADAFAIATCGPAALAATIELEWGEPAAMLALRGSYPPVLIRLALMSALAATLKLGGALTLDDLLPPLADAPRTLARARVTAAATALATMPLGGKDLATLGQTVRGPDDGFLDQALAGAPLDLDPARLQPLRAVAAGFRAYRSLAAIADEKQREQQRTALRDRLTPLIGQLRAPRDVLRDGASDLAPTAAEIATLVRDVGALLPAKTGAPPASIEVAP